VDLTWASPRILPHVVGWQVTDEITSSDHRMIEIKLEFASAVNTSTSTRRFATRSVDWHSFSVAVAQKADYWRLIVENTNCREDVERSAATITANLVSISESTLPRLKARSKSVPWWN